MPQITLSRLALLVLTLLPGVSVGIEPARAQQSSSSASNNSTRSRDLSAPQIPLRLVQRTAPVERTKAESRYGEPIELPAHKQAQRDEGGPIKPGATTTGGNVTGVVFSSLAIVLGLFFLVIWLARRALPKSATSLPTDVLEVLGRSPLASRHNLQLIRFGRRLLLVSVTPDNADTLAEITDPDEVNHLAGLCQQNRSESITGSFRQVLHQLGTPGRSRSRRTRESSSPLGTGNDTPREQRTSLRPVREMP